MTVLTALGVDVSTNKIALVALDTEGDLKAYNVPVMPGQHGAVRLRQVRAAVRAALQGRFPTVHAAMVEIPWAKRGSSFALLSIAGVCLEAVQSVHHGAVVFDVPTQTWKLESVGHGNATKAQVAEHARGLGLLGDDQDQADACCLAQAALERLLRHINPKEVDAA